MTSTLGSAAQAAKPIWFITGCSTGFGRELAEHLLKSGHRVVVTAREVNEVSDLAALGDALLLALDVTDPEAIASAIRTTTSHFGRIDVLINNAGIGYFAAIEEGEEEQIRTLWDINVFGVIRMIQAVLPAMRERRSGFIVNMSSIGGLTSIPAVGFYNASKYAVEGLSEALWQEVNPLGIKVMLVEPSGFRTDWAGRSANESHYQIADYAATAGANRKSIRASSGKQAGDPARAALAIIAAVESEHPPHRLLLGNMAFDSAMAKLKVLREEFQKGEALSRSVDTAAALKEAPLKPTQSKSAG